METKIVLFGEPKSTSHIYKMTCRGRFASMYMSQAGKEIKSRYALSAKGQLKCPPYETDISVIYDLYFGTKRKCDADNFNKLVGDALTGIVWIDDSQIQELFIRKHYDKKNPRIEITIKNYDKS